MTKPMPERNQTIEPIKYDLQLEENLQQHRKGWIIQKIGWGILYLGLIFALAGIFGSGPLSYKTQAHDNCSVEYEQYLRYEGEAEITFKIDDVKDSVSLEIPQRYMEYIDIKSITPLPYGNRTVNGLTTWYFHASGQANIHCNVMAKKPGRITTTIKVNQTPFNIAHQIYP
jgi:hypothetical protein